MTQFLETRLATDDEAEQVDWQNRSRKGGRKGKKPNPEAQELAKLLQSREDAVVVKSFEGSPLYGRPAQKATYLRQTLRESFDLEIQTRVIDRDDGANLYIRLRQEE